MREVFAGEPVVFPFPMAELLVTDARVEADLHLASNADSRGGMVIYSSGLEALVRRLVVVLAVLALGLLASVSCYTVLPLATMSR
jgi:hypothetical protein